MKFPELPSLRLFIMKTKLCIHTGIKLSFQYINFLSVKVETLYSKIKLYIFPVFVCKWNFPKKTETWKFYHTYHKFIRTSQKQNFIPFVKLQKINCTLLYSIVNQSFPLFGNSLERSPTEGTPPVSPGSTSGQLALKTYSNSSEIHRMPWNLCL